MKTDLRSLVRPAASLLVAFTLLTGALYPALVTGLARLLFPGPASGSLIHRDGRAIGSALIGQWFDAPRYFWPRPSATSPVPYNAAASTGSNLGPTNPALLEAVRRRVEQLRLADPGNLVPVPVDLVTASGSGLDPDISPAAAAYQVARVARARGLDSARIVALVTTHTIPRTFGILGEPRVNVLRLNLALDSIAPMESLRYPK